MIHSFVSPRRLTVPLLLFELATTLIAIYVSPLDLPALYVVSRTIPTLAHQTYACLYRAFDILIQDIGLFLAELDEVDYCGEDRLHAGRIRFNQIADREVENANDIH